MMNESNSNTFLLESQDWKNYLGSTFYTAAAEFLDKAFEVVLAVVIGNFFSYLDVSFGHDEDTATTIERFTVGPTGMIGIPSRIVARTAIDIPLGIDIEHVAIVTKVTLACRDTFANVFNNSRILLNRRQGK